MNISRLCPCRGGQKVVDPIAPWSGTGDAIYFNVSSENGVHGKKEKEVRVERHRETGGQRQKHRDRKAGETKVRSDGSRYVPPQPPTHTV